MNDKVLVLFLFLTLTIVHAEINAKLKVSLLNTGFHRDLIYNLELTNIIANECEFSLVQDIPSSVYVNLDELNDLKKFNKIFSYIPTYIDVELSTPKSLSHRVYLYDVAKTKNIITLPLHFRYHSPGYRKFVEVFIESPKLLIKCEHDIFSNTTVVSPCSNSASIVDFDELRFADSCDWKEIEFINTQPTIVAKIPIGNLKMKNIITIGTLITSWCGCIYLIYSMYYSKYILNKN